MLPGVEATRKTALAGALLLCQAVPGPNGGPDGAPCQYKPEYAQTIYDYFHENGLELANFGFSRRKIRVGLCPTPRYFFAPTEEELVGHASTVYLNGI